MGFTWRWLDNRVAEVVRGHGSKTVFFGQEVHYYMVYIAYFSELYLQICDYVQNDAFVAKIVNTRLTKIFMAIFAPDERLPSSATLDTYISRILH